MKFILSIFNSVNVLIIKSLKTTDEVSATRLQSYLLLALIQLMILVVVGIEVVAFGHSTYIGKEYVLSNEFIIAFATICSHHLAVLFSRSKSQSIKELKGGDTSNEEGTATNKEPSNSDEPKLPE